MPKGYPKSGVNKGWFRKGSKGSLFWLGKKMTLETRKKMSESSPKIWLGKKFSEEHRNRLKVPHKFHCLSEETKKKISLAHLGKKHSLEHRKNHSLSITGRKLPLSVRLKMVKSARRGEKNNMWKGGITPINKQIRHSFEYKIWRESVFKRDNWTCVWCLKRGSILHAEHIKPFAYFPELRFELSNGRTLCIECHSKTDSYKRKYSVEKLNHINGK